MQLFSTTFYGLLVRFQFSFDFIGYFSLEALFVEMYIVLYSESLIFQSLGVISHFHEYSCGCLLLVVQKPDMVVSVNWPSLLKKVQIRSVIDSILMF